MEKIERVCWEENIDSCIVVKTEIEKRNIPINETKILLVEDKLSNRKTIEIYLRSRELEKLRSQRTERKPLKCLPITTEKGLTLLGKSK